MDLWKDPSKKVVQQRKLKPFSLFKSTDVVV